MVNSVFCGKDSVAYQKFRFAQLKWIKVVCCSGTTLPPKKQTNPKLFVVREVTGKYTKK